MTLPSRLPSPKAALRGCALGTAAVLAASTLAMLPTGAAQAVGVDPQPSTAGAAWLRANLGGASVPDSLEAALGLARVGDTATATTTRDAVAPLATAYVAPGGDEDPNATARVAWYAQQLGADANTYGGRTLLDDLAGDIPNPTGDTTTTPPAGSTPGRLQDPEALPPDNLTPATVITTAGQIFATAALVAGGAPYAAKAAAAVTWTAGLQCPTGFFVDALPDATGSVTCSVPAQQSVRTTALYVIAMRGSAAAAAPVAKAVDWLAKEQQSNGRWVADGGAGPGDSTSTALASYALALAGRTGPATQGAVWLRGNQLVNAGTCAAYPATDTGAVAPDGGTYAGTAGRVADFRLATARSLLVLGQAPGGPGITDNALSLPKFAQPGRTVKASVRTAPRNLLCASATTLAATRVLGGYDSTADFDVTTGAGGATTATITDATGQVDTATVTVLAKKKLAFSFKDKRVRSGKKAVVKVRGLAPGESVSLALRGKKKTATVAGSQGTAKLRFTANGKRGVAKVKVVGQFDNRKRSKNLIITRR